jgi:hypothetical protein
MLTVGVDLASEIKLAHSESCAALSRVRSTGAAAVAKAIECGHLLLRQRRHVASRDWRRWLRENCPELSRETVRCYIHCAENADKIELGSVASLRHAYQLAGCIASSAKGRDAKPERPTVEFVRGLDQFRIWFNRRTRTLPLRRWSPEAKRLLRNELLWFKSLHDRLASDVEIGVERRM